MLNGLGGPPNKFATQDDLKDFVTDYTNSLTQSELISLTMGEATTDSLDIAMTMLGTEYQNLTNTFPDRDSVSNFLQTLAMFYLLMQKMHCKINWPIR